MEGGSEAGLYSINHPDDLITLAGRAARVAAPAFTAASGGQQRDITVP